MRCVMAGVEPAVLGGRPVASWHCEIFLVCYFFFCCISDVVGLFVGGKKKCEKRYTDMLGLLLHIHRYTPH